MNSLRSRLIISVIGGILLLLTIFGLIVYSVIRRALINQFDESLASIARMLAASVEIDGNQIDLEFEAQQIPEFQNSTRPTYYQLWRQDDTIVTKSSLLGPNELSRIEGPLNAPVFRVLQGKDGQPQRAVGFKFIPRLSDSDEVNGGQKTKEQMLTLVVARDASGLYRQLDLLQWLLLVAGGVTISLSIFIAALVVRGGLRPLNFIAAEIANVREDNLAARIGTETIPDELVPIKNRLNELLSRLEDSFNRERRFTADVAHELRTPLAGLRSTIEVTLVRARNAAEYQTVLSECLAIVESMQKMTNNLLMLARIDAHQMTFHKGRIELAKLVDSCWRSFSDKAMRRNIAFDNRIPAQMVCESDPDCLFIVLSNLFDNAVEYANKAGKIWVEAHQRDDSVEISIANTGCQLADEQVSHIFDRFWRADVSRANTGAHCGLGLAMVERLVRALGGSIDAELQSGGIFIIRLVLPTAYLAGATQ